jgi:hypothetical protein
MAISLANEAMLRESFSILESIPDTRDVVYELRDLLGVDHVAYALHGTFYFRLTYPAAWLKRYVERDYTGVDPILREGLQRKLPFQWNKLTIRTAAERSFMADALSHGIGPYGFSVPLSLRGYGGVFSITTSKAAEEWSTFLSTSQPALVEIANRLHRRALVEVFGKDQVVERHLAAILAADVAGYSRLMRADEEGTLNRLNAHRRELLEPTVAQHHGRIVKRMGDGILIEFASVMDATPLRNPTSKWDGTA